MCKRSVCVFTNSDHMKLMIQAKLDEMYRLVFAKEIVELKAVLKAEDIECLIASIFQNGTCFLSELIRIKQMFAYLHVIAFCTESQLQTISACADKLACDFYIIDDVKQIPKVLQSALDQSRFLQNIFPTTKALVDYPPRVKKALKIIHSSFTKIKLASEVSQQLGISVVTFRKEFRQSVGVSFTQYLIGLKMQYAVFLSKNNGLSQKNIARRCGYDDDAQFSRVFRKKMGIPFSVFRTRNIQ